AGPPGVERPRPAAPPAPGPAAAAAVRGPPGGGAPRAGPRLGGPPRTRQRRAHHRPRRRRGLLPFAGGAGRPRPARTSGGLGRARALIHAPREAVRLLWRAPPPPRPPAQPAP